MAKLPFSPTDFLKIKVILFLIAFFFLFQNLFTLSRTKQFHEDEVTFIERGLFFDWYSTGDFKRSEWKSFDSYDVPKFAELFYGADLRLNSGQKVVDTLRQSGFFDQNQTHAGNWRLTYSRNFCCSIQDLPPDIVRKIQPILIARQSSLIITLLSLILIFLIGSKIKGSTYGLISMVVIGTNVLFQNSMVTTMGDNFLLFFSLLFFLIHISASKEIIAGKRKGLLCVMLLGIIAGLATATKLNGVLNLLFFALFSFILVLQKKIRWSLFFKYLLIILSAAYVVFFFLNPFVWSNPIQNSLKMSSHRIETIRYQQLLFPRFSLPILPNRISAFYNTTLAPHASFANFSFEHNSFPLDFCLFIFGGYLLLQKQKGNKKKKYLIPSEFILWLCLFFLTPILTIPLNWERYWLPVIVSISFIQSLSIDELLTDLKTHFE